MRCARALCAALCFVAASGRSTAAEIARSKDQLSVQGRIQPGDDLKFEAAARRGPYRTVDLISRGGDLSAAAAIARSIRAAGADTVYDASRGPCSSACTVLFVAGVHRHYVGGDGIREGIGPKGGRGLGFHQAYAYDPGQAGRSMGRLMAMYYEMGSPQGAELSNRSPPQTLYYVPAATALSLGVATSLRRP